MRRFVYWAGRALQLSGLLVLPSAIWVGSMGHQEKNCIIIFVACTMIFYTGYFLTRLGMRLE